MREKKIQVCKLNFIECNMKDKKCKDCGITFWNAVKCPICYPIAMSKEDLQILQEAQKG